MKTAILVITLMLVMGLSYAQGGPGCGPTPMIPNQQFNQPVQQSLSQAAQQQKQIQVIQAQADYNAATARIQTQQTISNIQNQGNPQMQQQNAAQFQTQMQQLKQNFDQQIQNLQRQ